ncbi:MAG: ABC transporter substrate-binding protein [Clostridiales bacterium]|nr:ABC transporter substrate-binding protein [Clostridiales bacterium]
MSKMKVFSSCVLVILLMVCAVFLFELHGCTPRVSVPDDAVAGERESEGSGPAVVSRQDFPLPIVEEWVLPTVVSITGADSEAGLAAAWGFDYGVKTVNEQGGIRELPVRIAIRDAASSENAVRTEIGQAAADSALIVLGPSTEESYTAGGQTFYSVGMPALGAATDDMSRDRYQPFAISCIADPGSEAVSAIETWVRAEQFTRVFIFNSYIYDDRTKLAEEALLASGKEVAERFEVGHDAFDAASVAERAIASGADAYYIDMSGEDTLRIIRQLHFLAGEAASALKILCGPQAADMALIESAEDGEMLGVRVWATLDPNRGVEKRRAFDEAFERSVGDLAYYSLAVDYYQAALMLKEAFDELRLTGAPEELESERRKLALHLYNTGFIATDQGDFIIEAGSKFTAAKLYTITENGFQS